MFLDIPALSMQLSMNKLQNDWGTAMLSKSLDSLQKAGETITDMIDESIPISGVNPNIGSNIDITV